MRAVCVIDERLRRFRDTLPAARADQAGRVLNVRLVKGAYWDSEIKRAQERGLDGYPVYTRKHHTDVAYLACAGTALGFPPGHTG